MYKFGTNSFAKLYPPFINICDLTSYIMIEPVSCAFIFATPPAFTSSKFTCWFPGDTHTGLFKKSRNSSVDCRVI